MLDNKKIVLMTKLALYEKNDFKKDKKITEFYRHDYITKENIWNRLFVFLGAVILLLIYYFKKFFVDGEDFFNMINSNLIRVELGNCLKFIIVLLIIYSGIGFIKYNVEYTISQRKVKKYSIMLEKLNKLSLSEEDNKEAKK